jgi:biotin operon repressor
MSLLKSIDRLKRIDTMIRQQATGTSDEFARKLGISRSMLMENLREMKDLGASICFCPHRRTYFYTTEFGLLIGNISKDKVKGGSIVWSNWYKKNIFTQSNGIGHLNDTLALPSW